MRKILILTISLILVAAVSYAAYVTCENMVRDARLAKLSTAQKAVAEQLALAIKNKSTSPEEKDARAAKLSAALKAAVDEVMLAAKNRKISPEEAAKERAEGKKAADLMVTYDRAKAQRFLNDLAVMFPDGISAMCYQSAVSNYVEDQWNRIARQTGCDSDQIACIKTKPSEDALTDVWMSGLDTKTKIKLGNMWPVAGGLYNYIRPFEGYFSDAWAKPDDHNKISSEEFSARVNEFNRYVKGCAGLKPVSWSVVGEPFDDPSTNAIKLGVYKLLIEGLATHSLSDDNKPYVSCLSALTEMIDHPPTSAKYTSGQCRDDKACIENIPTDTKEFLFRTLNDLKAHKCEFSYVYNVTHH